MRSTTLLIAAWLSIIPLSSYALSGDAQTQEYIEKHQNAVRAYASQTNKPMPEIVEYKYGMKLDVVKVVRQTPVTQSCEVMPRLMTYENSVGELITMQYQVLSECRNKH